MNFGHRTGAAALVVAVTAVIAGWPVAPAEALVSAAGQSFPAAQQASAPFAGPTQELGVVTTSATAAAAQEATLTIRTAPPLAGVRLSLDHTVVTTDESGVASVTQERGSQAHTLTLLDTNVETTDKKYAFTRWVGQRDPDQAFVPTLDSLSLRDDSALTAAFTVQHAITPDFVDQNGQAIDPALVTSAAARSDTGAVVNVTPTGTTWLEGTRVVSRPNGVEIRNTSYSWQTVVVAGTNVVDAGRQSFSPATTPDVTVVGQFHDLTITGYDAMLGYPTGREAVLTFPDGSVRTEPLDGASTATFTHLPRGTYQAKVTAGSSVVGDHQVRLSRDITLLVPVISPVDLAILLGAFLMVAVGLVLVGRRSVRHRIFRPIRRAASQEVKTG